MPSLAALPSFLAAQIFLPKAVFAAVEDEKDEFKVTYSVPLLPLHGYLTAFVTGSPVLPSISDMRCEVPELRGDNFMIWKERILLQLGCMNIDYAIRKDEPHKITDTSTPEEILLYERWEKSNRLSVTYIKTKISASIRGLIEQHENVRELLKAIDEQFITSNKALASTLIMKFTSLKLTGIRGVCEHIMEMRDIVAQLKKLEVEMSESFLVHFILNTLPPQYEPFKISYDSLRIILALVTHYDLELQQMDVKTTFFNGELEEEVYMKQPEGFPFSDGEQLVCKLKKSIYGLKQASRQWYLKFHNIISSFGFGRKCYGSMHIL
ncbi:Retrovirus-related Pol polyprotein from transposon TNT 1-94 [Vitis vinifera]|uniref:Retrovirus-related Pol polyprotein from transposon TNT 1-94 n=1 Tax=Vitis vinifera TaxID=29760 RepID=A0A438C7A8_VITVI|nr:Retrovirus-related Pol polyprotein from transposon TNT 1-94 [Vitis vinifera]